MVLVFTKDNGDHELLKRPLFASPAETHGNSTDALCWRQTSPQPLHQLFAVNEEIVNCLRKFTPPVVTGHDEFTNHFTYQLIHPPAALSG